MTVGDTEPRLSFQVIVEDEDCGLATPLAREELLAGIVFTENECFNNKDNNRIVAKAP